MFGTIYLHNQAAPLAKRAASRRVVGPYRWRPAKPGTGRGFYTDTALECARHGSGFRLRLEEANDHIEGCLRHTSGYYYDRDGDGDTLQPIIARLPHGRGYLAGWTMGAGMASALGATIYADPTDAAYVAHSMAEHDAELNRNDHPDDDDED